MKIFSTKYYLFVSIGLFFFSFYVYVRFIRERLPRDLTIITLDGNLVIINYSLLLFTLLSIVISIFICTLNILILINKQIFYSSKEIPSFLIKLVKFIDQILASLHHFVVNLMDDPYNKMKPLIITFYTKMNNKEKYIIIAYYIPFLINCLALLYDIFLLNELHYFYKTLIILIIPLLLNIWFYSMLDWLEGGKEFVNDYLSVQHEYLPDGQDKYLFKILPDKRDEVDTQFLKYCTQEYGFCMLLNTFIENYNSIKHFYGVRINILIYLCFVCSWLYVILKNIYCIL